MKLRDMLKYLTNNEEKSRHEELFDNIFLVVNFLSLVIGTLVLISIKEYHWIAFLIIEHNWALDNMRHNRV